MMGLFCDYNWSFFFSLCFTHFHKSFMLITKNVGNELGVWLWICITKLARFGVAFVYLPCTWVLAYSFDQYILFTNKKIFEFVHKSPHSYCLCLIIDCVSFKFRTPEYVLSDCHDKVSKLILLWDSICFSCLSYFVAKLPIKKNILWQN